MPLDEPFFKSTPGPRMPGDSGFDERLRASASDASSAIRSLQDFLRRYKDTDIKTADGKIVTVLARRNRTSEHAVTDYFSVSDISTADQAKVRVAAGIIRAPDISGCDSDPPTIGAILKEYPVAGVDLDVSDGSRIYVKITTESGSSFTVTLTAESDDYVSVETEETVKVFTGTSGEIVALTSAPTPSALLSYALIAVVSVTNGSVRFTEEHPGAITVPAVIIPRPTSLTATSAIGGANYWTCVDGTPTEASFLVPA